MLKEQVLFKKIAWQTRTKLVKLIELFSVTPLVSNSLHFHQFIPIFHALQNVGKLILPPKKVLLSPI